MDKSNAALTARTETRNPTMSEVFWAFLPEHSYRRLTCDDAGDDAKHVI